MSVVVLVCLLWLGFRDGGYFPITWSVGSLVLLWIVIIMLLWRRELVLGRFDWALLIGLAAFLVWTWLSALWSIDAPDSILEGERTLLYLAGGAAVLTVASRQSARAVGFAVMLAATVLCGYALGDRLVAASALPYDRLGGPVGYWNALGILAAGGACLAVAFVAHESRPLARAIAGGSLPILVGALYLTFSRGSWLALAVGLAVSVVLDRNRTELIAALGALVLPCLAVVAFEASAHALITPGAAIADVTADGHRVALLAVAMSAACAPLAIFTPHLAARIPVLSGRAMTRVAAAGVVCAVAAAIIGTGGPARIPGAAASAFDATPPNYANGLNARLLSFSGSGRGEYWRVALTTFASDPLVGHGAGSFARLWLMKRHLTLTVQDAHSMYLETLSELGVVGLMLLLVVLAVPLAVARPVLRAGRANATYVPVLTGAYIAFLVHAALDWDWEMPVVTMSAFACGAAIVAAARADSSPLHRRVRIGALVSTLGLASCAFVFLIGTRELNAAQAAAAQGSASLAGDAHAAERWAPWSPDPLRWLASQQLDRGNRAAARRLLVDAIDKDGTDWSLWLELAAATRGPARQRAIVRAQQLDPIGPDVAQTEAAYGLAEATPTRGQP